MGLFDWFRSAPRPRFELAGDFFWSSQAAKLAGIEAAIARSLSPGRDAVDAVMLVSHFPDTCMAMQQVVDKNDYSDLALISTTAHAVQTIPPAEMAFTESQAIEMIVAERHWLRELDDAVPRYGEALRCRCRLSFHLALDDPLVAMAAESWPDELRKSVAESSSAGYQDPRVDESIRTVQQRVARQSTGDKGCVSAAAWYERNGGEG